MSFLTYLALAICLAMLGLSNGQRTSSNCCTSNEERTEVCNGGLYCKGGEQEMVTMANIMKALESFEQNHTLALEKYYNETTKVIIDMLTKEVADKDKKIDQLERNLADKSTGITRNVDLANMYSIIASKDADIRRLQELMKAKDNTTNAFAGTMNASVTLCEKNVVQLNSFLKRMNDSVTSCEHNLYKISSFIAAMNHTSKETANACSCQNGLELLNSTLTSIYHEVVKANGRMKNVSKGWKLVFKASAGIQKSVFEAWQNPAKSSPMDINSLHAESYHYKSSIVDNWAEQGIKKLLLVLAKDGKEVRRFEFNGEGTDKMNWFSARNLLSNSYTDLTSTTTTKYFSIVGDNENHQTWANVNRRFFINASYNGCGDDRGWLCVVDNKNPVCSWENTDHFPRFLYSPTNTVYRWDNTNVGNQGRADVMAIFVKTE